MDKYVYDENNGLWYELQEDSTFYVLPYQPRKKSLLGYEDSDTNAT